MSEIWKDINEYRDFYQVSDLGNVRSDGWPFNISITHGYLKVGLHGGDKVKYYSIYRLVAEAFIPNPENKPQINHKNKIREIIEL